MTITNIFFNKSAFGAAIFALCVNVLFLYFYDSTHHYTTTQLHGQLAYNAYRYNTLGINPQLTKHIDALREQKNRLIDYAEVTDHDFGPPTEPIDIYRTVGYGVMLWFLWKLTGSLQFLDVQLLQILLFVLSIFFLFQIAFFLFNSHTIAFWCSIAQSLFFPLVAMNVIPMHDVWIYYGMVALMYGILAYLKSAGGLYRLGACTIVFSICQFIRPAAVIGLLTLVLFLLVYAWLAQNKRALKSVLIIGSTNLLFFWLPFMALNKHYYNRFLVGPAGQNMLQGLGEFPNKWNYKLSDAWIAEYIEAQYGYKAGTQEFDDAAKKEFWQAFRQEPLFYFTSVLRRLPRLIVPSLHAIFMPYDAQLRAAKTGQEKLRCMLSSVSCLADVAYYYGYLLLFYLVAYYGLFLLVWQQHFFAVFFILSAIAGGFGVVPSHIEFRYLIPFYWAFSLFAGYGLASILHYLKRKHSKAHK